MSKYTEAVLKFVAECQKYGFDWEVRSDSVLTISQRFAPGDDQAFTKCDMMAGFVLALAPLKGGSVWGTDGGSIGGHVGLMRGEFRMNKSGSGTYFMRELRKHYPKSSERAFA
jgi:hypothetical protein